MEGQDVALVIPQCSRSVCSEVAGTKIVEEGARVCPLCKSEIRLFFINFNEKLLMCENTECEFPFGHEELQFVKEDNEVQSDEELETLKMGYDYTSCSAISAAAWSEIDRINQVTGDCNLEMHSDIRKYVTRPHKENQTNINEKQILENVNKINGLNEELNEIENDDIATPVIKNEKWIKNLKSKQEMSGVQLLSDMEMQSLKKEEPNIGTGELKIDIDPGTANSMSCITIEINNKE